MSQTLPWRAVVQALPEFMSWYVQRYGPIPDDSPGLTQAEYERAKAVYEEEYAAEAEAYDDSDWPS